MKTDTQAVKWVAEKIMLKAMEQQVPIQVHRLGLITGGAVVGLSPEQQWFSKILETCYDLGIYTNDYLIGSTSVDFVARASVKLSMDATDESGIYHLTNPELVPLGNFFEFSRNQDKEFVNVNMHEFLQIIREKSSKTILPINSIIDIHSEAISGQLQHEYWINRMNWSCETTLKKLASVGIKFPDEPTHYANYLTAFGVKIIS